MRGFRFLFEDGKLPLKTMTGDRGKEFACYQEVEKTLGVPSISSPFWQPSVENRIPSFSREAPLAEVTQVMDMSITEKPDLPPLVRQFSPPGRGTNLRRSQEMSPQILPREW